MLKKVVFATRNTHKIAEANKIFRTLPGYQSSSFPLIISLDEIGCFEDIPESSGTIQGNAIQKARYVVERYGVNCFAEDTGLFVEALDGRPGVHSARYAGLEKDPDKNIDLLLEELKKHQNRSAYFLTVIALIVHNELHLFDGKIEGAITNSRKGKLGFGYDPIFQPRGQHHTFGQMSIVEKNKISHRSQAFKKLTEYFQSTS